MSIASTSKGDTARGGRRRIAERMTAEALGMPYSIKVLLPSRLLPAIVSILANRIDPTEPALPYLAACVQCREIMRGAPVPSWDSAVTTARREYLRCPTYKTASGKPHARGQVTAEEVDPEPLPLDPVPPACSGRGGN